MLTLILTVDLIVAGPLVLSASTARKVEAVVAPGGKFLVIYGQRLHYFNIGGAGPAVVLIHSLGVQAVTLAKIVRGLRSNNFHNTSSDAVAVMEDLQAMMNRYCESKVPLGMLFAKGDLILDCREHGEEMKKQCSALDLMLLDGRGHMSPLIAPDAATDLICRIAELQLEFGAGR